jgi:hypothetical protein
VQAGNGLRGDLHEFLLTSRGTALFTSYVITTADLRSVGGPKGGTIQDAIFQELDIATGRVLLEWHSLDHIALAESYWPTGKAWDYVHLNSVDVDADDGNLLVSSRNTHTLYKVDRARARSSGDSAASTATSRSAPARRSPGSTTPAATLAAWSRCSTTRARRSPRHAVTVRSRSWSMKPT